MIMNCHSAVLFVATVVVVARFPTALRKNGAASFCHCDKWPYDFSGSTRQVFPGLFLRGERGETLLDTANIQSMVSWTLENIWNLEFRYYNSTYSSRFPRWLLGFLRTLRDTALSDWVVYFNLGFQVEFHRAGGLGPRRIQPDANCYFMMGSDLLHQQLQLGETTIYIHLPVVPHKAVAEVSRIGHYRRGELLWCMDGRANPLMDRRWLELCFLEWLQWLQWSPHHNCWM